MTHLHQLMQRDVRDLGRIGGVTELFHLQVGRSGDLLNASRLVRDAELNNATPTRHLDLPLQPLAVPDPGACLGRQA